MKNIRIGTCVPGRNFAQWAPKLVQAGFECVTVNYHMEMEPEELAALPEIVKRALDGTSATDMMLGLSVAMVSAMYWLATCAYSLAISAASCGSAEVTVISSMRVSVSLDTESMFCICE